MLLSFDSCAYYLNQNRDKDADSKEKIKSFEKIEKRSRYHSLLWETIEKLKTKAMVC